MPGWLRDHAAAQASGAGHHALGAPPLSVSQRVIMGVSSLFYLCSAAAWHRFGFHRLCCWFCLVAALSVCADAMSGLLHDQLMRRVRIADRSVGTAGLISAVVCNSNSPTNLLLSLASVLSALCWLVKGRSVAIARPRNRWEYLFFHGMWHAWGAIALVAVTFHAQR